MTKFSESIIGKIKCEHIAPVPRWHFLLKGGVFWTLFGFSMILGSLSFSVIVHIVRSGDFGVCDHLQGNLITSAVMLLPYFWLVFLTLFIIVAYINWKCTKNGYRFRRRWIILVGILLSIIFGIIFYAIGMATKVDNLMTKTIPLYDISKHNARKELWLQPESGLLIGKIIEIDEVEEKIVLKDEEGREWIVADRAVGWEDDDLERKGKIIKVVGKKIGESEFEANEIRRCNDCQDDEDMGEVDEELAKKEASKNTHRNIIIDEEDSREE
ncbi:MAG TPA: hypothetical protein DEA43_02090 [Candidatus Moranbacteria bacterium]|nr:hypothetical protein [Candidatus Moranbacteria bacterium]HBT45654.1 hypothetical protein [Candidatus Moranbacteria bacterium]